VIQSGDNDNGDNDGGSKDDDDDDDDDSVVNDDDIKIDLHSRGSVCRHLRCVVEDQGLTWGCLHHKRMRHT
jgi:hypothetical protein